MLRIYITYNFMYNRILHYKLLMAWIIIGFMHYCVHIECWHFYNFVFLRNSNNNGLD